MICELVNISQMYGYSTSDYITLKFVNDIDSIRNTYVHLAIPSGIP